MYDPFEQEHQETTPAPLQPPTEQPEVVNSYTATPYDRYTAEHGNPVHQYYTPPQPKAKEKRTVSLASAVVCSAVDSVVCSLLVVLVMVYGMGLGSMLQSAPAEQTSPPQNDSTNTTNIVVSIDKNFSIKSTSYNTCRTNPNQTTKVKIIICIIICKKFI